MAAATQPSFLQHAVHLDTKTKKLSVIGEVNRRFIAFPELDTLLKEWDGLGRSTTIDSKKAEDNMKMIID